MISVMAINQLIEGGSISETLSGLLLWWSSPLQGLRVLVHVWQHMSVAVWVLPFACMWLWYRLNRHVPTCPGLTHIKTRGLCLRLYEGNNGQLLFPGVKRTFRPQLHSKLWRRDSSHSEYLKFPIDRAFRSLLWALTNRFTSENCEGEVFILDVMHVCVCVRHLCTCMYCMLVCLSASLACLSARDYSLAD